MKKLFIGAALTVVATLTANTSAQAENTDRQHTVQKGETLFEIAKEYGITTNTIIEINPQLNDINLIYPNQKINVVSNIPVAAAPIGIKNSTNNSTVNSTNHNESDIDLLARIVRAEAQGETFKGKVAVAEVVLNRMESKRFPNTIKGVIYQPNQFSPVNNGSINKAADQQSYEAAQTALQGTNYTNGALYFYNSNVATNRWLDGLRTTAVIGNHTFKIN